MTCLDAPYLNDLVLHLKRSDLIRDSFPSIGNVKLFVSPSELEAVLKKDCPFEEAIYIYLGLQKRSGGQGLNTCYLVEQVIGLVVLKKCSGKNFELEKDGEDITVGGEIAELSCLRKSVIEAMHCFESSTLTECKWTQTSGISNYDCWLASTIEFNLKFRI